MKYQSDDVVTTADGHRHRVLWTVGKDQKQLRVRCVTTKQRKAHTINVNAVVDHAPRQKRK